ncbi:LacI family DNA-binding transcriptional regulator [Lysobacter korlensis]|uniref:LacI family DNA-binding transcriptional regulator n=1 Tax=Lysobacter korlensis TaxID=553636 RepID=A0ABV6RT22_9GAMM
MTEELRSRRPTIADIAARAGTSKGAVSYALNGKAGVSAATRQRIEALAAEMGWAPSAAARSLSRSHADAVGLVLGRPATLLGSEPFFMEFIAGVQSALSPAGYSLMMNLVSDRDQELAILKRWRLQGRVDGVIVVNIKQDDPRIDFLVETGFPGVAVGGEQLIEGIRTLGAPTTEPMKEAVAYLRRLGHTRISRVGGDGQLVHIEQRDVVFTSLLGEDVPGCRIVHTDFSVEGGRSATRRLLSGEDPPTAIIYDSDVLGVAGLSVAKEFALDVPGDLSIVTFDDSLLCQLSMPPLTALRRDTPALGARAGRELLFLLRGSDTPPETSGGRGFELAVRGSTSPPRTASDPHSAPGLG